MPTSGHAQITQITVYALPAYNLVSACSNLREAKPAGDGCEPEINDTVFCQKGGSPLLEKPRNMLKA